MYGELKEIVPKQFAAVSPTTTHAFHILSPTCRTQGNLGWRAARHAQHVASCKLRQGTRLIPLVIPLDKEPLLGNAIAHLASLPRNGYRPAKYLDLYKILEGLGATPRPDHRVLRHALAHAPRTLTRPSTLDRLHVLFGKKHVDLTDPEHERVFWRLFGELLVDVDVLLGMQLEERLSEFAVFDRTRETA
jgi:hypothetical protein